jgi:signal transduction histidine kinase
MILELDWRAIFKDPNLDSSALDYEPEIGPKKQSAGNHGTTLTIRCLQGDWHIDKIRELGATQLAKLSDPFTSDFIHELLMIELQGERVLLPEFENNKLEKADAVCRARLQKVRKGVGLESAEELELSIEVEYRTFAAHRVWNLRGEHLASCIKDPPGRRRRPKANELLPNTDAVLAALPRLGPFEMEFHWFNRGRIMREDSDTWENIKEFVRSWSGGLLVYRDGFRVYPYGSPSDDWLDLDRSALSGSAYKLNRAQIIGFLKISQEGNPALQDQTNREGFRDCPEKEALRRLLRHVIITHCRLFLEDTLKSNTEEPPEQIESIEKRVGDSEQVATTKLYELQKRVPEEAEPINEIIFQLGEIRAAWERAKLTIRSQESELEQYVHLAGVGLQVEFIAHELSRVTADALRSLRDGDVLKDESVRLGLEMQLKTLDKRIRVLDLLSVPGRQRKVLVEVESIVTMLLEMHDAKIKRHGLDVSIQNLSGRTFRAKIEQGQILQILDNLFSNSFYWLNNRFDRATKPKITITLDPQQRLITFEDNGPGVPRDMRGDIFKPFVTTKPPGDGRGLGLFISRRLAEYNDATLSLGSADDDGRSRKFEISLKNTKSL